jgi:capsular polysaccharide transport system ATP-binding protein
MIEVNSLSKRYYSHLGSHQVFDNISFSIPKGVSVGVIGKNGAGKSTLLRLIAGMDSPDKGSITRNGRVSWPIGLTGGFQRSMTGRQNVKFIARIHGDHNEVNRIVHEVESFAEIGKGFDRPIKTYSAGMRARLAFGLSLAFDFDVYLSDEATSVGDAAFRKKATKAFKDRIGQSSIIMVSHGVGILKELCQAGLWIHEGKAFWFDDISEAISNYEATTIK